MNIENPLLELNNVVKNYDSYCAVNQVSFDIPRGCLFGLLGPNGAGKTSLIRIITTITRADSGTVLFDGHPINAQSAAWIGYMPRRTRHVQKNESGRTGNLPCTPQRYVGSRS
jgi:ABC-2 type transport system ATP-binding protein